MYLKEQEHYPKLQANQNLAPLLSIRLHDRNADVNNIKTRTTFLEPFLEHTYTAWVTEMAQV